jgi:hypothetical protein
VLGLHGSGALWADLEPGQLIQNSVRSHSDENLSFRFDRFDFSLSKRGFHYAGSRSSNKTVKAKHVTQ